MRLALTLACALACASGCDDNDEAGRARLRIQAPKLTTPQVDSPPVRAPRVEPPRVGAAPVRRPDLGGPRQVDLYRQREAALDILFVVDNSGSMANEREALARSFQRFFGALQARDMDFHIGVTSTDLSSGLETPGELRGPAPYIASTDDAARARAAFAEAVRFRDYRAEGLPSPGFEEGLRAADLALTHAPRGFLRAEAQLAVIVVTDEDDESYGELDYYVRRLRSHKGVGNERMVSFAAIAGAVPADTADLAACVAYQEDESVRCSGCIPPGDEDKFGACSEAGCRYWELARRVNLPPDVFDAEGAPELYYSICSTEFDAILADLAQSLGGLRRTFPLSAIPDVTTLDVRINGAPARSGWRYSPERRAIIFEPESTPPGSAEVRIRYGFGD